MKPPKYRHSHLAIFLGRTCHMCIHVDRKSGYCKKYKYKIARQATCDSFKARSEK